MVLICSRKKAERELPPGLSSRWRAISSLSSAPQGLTWLTKVGSGPTRSTTHNPEIGDPDPISAVGDAAGGAPIFDARRRLGPRSTQRCYVDCPQQRMVVPRAASCIKAGSRLADIRIPVLRRQPPEPSGHP